MYEKLEALDLKEVFGYAIYSEDAAVKYYHNLAKTVSELISQRFESLARDEATHKRMLLDLHKHLFGDEKYTVPEGLPPFESSVSVENVANLIEALENAILNEYNAYKVYRFLAKHNKEYRKLFKYFAVWERAHYETLRMEKEMHEENVMENPSIKNEPAKQYGQRIQKIL